MQLAALGIRRLRYLLLILQPIPTADSTDPTECRPDAQLFAVPRTEIHQKCSMFSQTLGALFRKKYSQSRSC